MALPNGESLAYIDRGERSGPAVVLIHGYTDNARDWVPMLPYLSKRYRLILVDIRGHGQSGKPECCYTRLDFPYDIKLLLDALGVPKTDIVGHSLGRISTQAIWGCKDAIMEEDGRQSLRDALPNAKVKTFDGLGHNPFWEDPRSVAEVINAFLNAPN